MSKGRSWIFTSVANGHYLTYDVFNGAEFLVDECHFTSDAAVVYTYAHFKHPVEKVRIVTFREMMRHERNIIPFDVFGYDSAFTANSDEIIYDHVGFKMLLNHYQTKNLAFSSCTDGTPGVSRGLLWNADSVPRIKDILRSRNRRLELFFESMEKELAASKQEAGIIGLMQEEISRRDSMIEDLKHYKFVCCVLKYRIGSLDKTTQDILWAPDHRGLPLLPW